MTATTTDEVKEQLKVPRQRSFLKKLKRVGVYSTGEAWYWMQIAFPEGYKSIYHKSELMDLFDELNYYGEVVDVVDKADAAAVELLKKHTPEVDSDDEHEQEY